MFTVSSRRRRRCRVHMLDAHRAAAGVARIVVADDRSGAPANPNRITAILIVCEKRKTLN